MSKAFPREHGTDRGYQQHRNRKDMPACEPCRAAHTIATLANDRRRRAARVRCVECGEPAAPGRRRYCGEECYRLGKNRRERTRGLRRRTTGDRAPQRMPVETDLPRVRWIKRGLVYVVQREQRAS